MVLSFISVRRYSSYASETASELLKQVTRLHGEDSAITLKAKLLEAIIESKEYSNKLTHDILEGEVNRLREQLEKVRKIGHFMVLRGRIEIIERKVMEELKLDKEKCSRRKFWQTLNEKKHPIYKKMIENGETIPAYFAQELYKDISAFIKCLSMDEITGSKLSSEGGEDLFENPLLVSRNIRYKNFVEELNAYGKSLNVEFGRPYEQLTIGLNAIEKDGELFDGERYDYDEDEEFDVKDEGVKAEIAEDGVKVEGAIRDDVKSGEADDLNVVEEDNDNYSEDEVFTDLDSDFDSDEEIENIEDDTGSVEGEGKYDADNAVVLDGVKAAE